jgi:hypothetical protein
MQTMNDVRGDAADMATRAGRTAADTSRRTIEQLQTATRVGRNWLEESSQLNRKLLAAWAVGMEVPLRAGFEMQNAALTASIPIYDLAAKQWVTVIRQMQETSIEVLRMNVRMLEKATLNGTAEMATK